MEKKDVVLEYIKNLIMEDKIKVGDKLPSENVLSKELNVSRVVVREALGILDKNKVIEKHKGYGSTLINSSNYKKKKYIIITILYKYLIDEYTFAYKYIIDKLQKLIKLEGYTPI